MCSSLTNNMIPYLIPFYTLYKAEEMGKTVLANQFVVGLMPELKRKVAGTRTFSYWLGNIIFSLLLIKRTYPMQIILFWQSSWSRLSRIHRVSKMMDLTGNCSLNSCFLVIVCLQLRLNSAPMFMHFPPKGKPKKADTYDIQRYDSLLLQD